MKHWIITYFSWLILITANFTFLYFKKKEPVVSARLREREAKMWCVKMDDLIFHSCYKPGCVKTCTFYLLRVLSDPLQNIYYKLCVI